MGAETIDEIFHAAMQQLLSGHLAEAEQLYRQILAEQPDHASATLYLGVIALQLGRGDAAFDLIGRATTLNPNLAEAHINFGIALAGKGRQEEAIESFRRAIALNPNSAQAHYNLGVSLREQGQFDEAIVSFRRFISINPGLPEVHNNLGLLLAGEGKFEEAIAAYRKAIALNDNLAEVHNNLGMSLAGKGDLDEAIAAYHRAIAFDPELSEAHNNLGNALRDQGKLDEAIDAYRHAIALNSNMPEAHSNLGNALRDEGKLDAAIDAYQDAIALSPNLAETHNNLAMALLLVGKDFEKGWREYEWRWKCRDFPSPQRNFAQPLWDGERLEDRIILLHAEQGFGDAIQFIRYVPLVAGRGGKIIVECQAELLRLFQTIGGICQMVVRGHPLPNFDVHCPLVSLPRVFRTKLDNLPSIVPYLWADVAETGRWKQRLANQPRELNVGLAWAGSASHKDDRNRSMTLASLASLGKLPGVRFISLQKASAGNEAKSPPAGMELIDWTEELGDFADSAALVANLDLVIAVDTAAAHLAGAMGKPVWTLLPFVPDWRWLMGREDTPWYPSMRLFRQPSRGDWDNVARRVADALSHWIVGRS